MQELGLSLYSLHGARVYSCSRVSERRVIELPLIVGGGSSKSLSGMVLSHVGHSMPRLATPHRHTQSFARYRQATLSKVVLAQGGLAPPAAREFVP